MGVDVVGRLDQLRLREVDLRKDHPVLHIAVGRDDDDQQAAVPTGAGTRCDGKPRRGAAPSPRRRTATGSTAGWPRWRSPSAAGRPRRLGARDAARAAPSAWCRRKADSRAPSECGRPRCGGWRSARAPRGRTSHCGWSPATGRGPRHATSVREPTGCPSAM